MRKRNICNPLRYIVTLLLFFIPIAFFLFDGKPPAIYIPGLNMISISIILLSLEILLAILIAISISFCQHTKNEI